MTLYLYIFIYIIFNFKYPLKTDFEHPFFILKIKCEKMKRNFIFINYFPEHLLENNNDWELIIEFQLKSQLLCVVIY